MAAHFLRLGAGGVGGSAVLVERMRREFQETRGGVIPDAYAVVVGSGLAVVPFLHGGIVREMQWRTERRILDAVAVSMITPGPVIVTVAFIGYLAAYLTVALLARGFHRVARNGSLRAAVDGATAAATGEPAGRRPGVAVREYLVLSGRKLHQLSSAGYARRGRAAPRPRHLLPETRRERLDFRVDARTEIVGPVRGRAGAPRAGDAGVRALQQDLHGPRRGRAPLRRRR